MKNELKPFWNKYFNFDWKFGLFLILLLCIPRIVLVLHGNQIGNMQFVGIMMLFMAVAPFIFLSKHGRYQIGIKKPANYSWLMIVICIGLTFSCFFTS